MLLSCRLAKVKRMVVSTYQAASGAGAAAMEELREQTRDVLDGKEAKPVIFPYQVSPSCSSPMQYNPQPCCCVLQASLMCTSEG